MTDLKLDLPMLEPAEPEHDGHLREECGPRVYVTQEEKVILDAMRALRERALALRTRLDEGLDRGQALEVEQELDRLRDQRHELERRREIAYRNKMIMLGHLPPEDVELI